MKHLGFIAILILCLAGPLFAQTQNDTVPAFIDTMKVVTIYADTGQALNRVDSRGRKQGLWEKKYANGNPRYRGHFYNDKPIGIFKYYYDNDSIKMISRFADTGHVARVCFYNLDGNIIADGKFVGHKKDSIWKYFDNHSILISKEQYHLGKKDGKFETFFTNGGLADEQWWKDGKEYGAWKEFYYNGQLKTLIYYKNGKRDGKAAFYYNDGKVHITGGYKNDMQDGVWIFYNPDRSIKAKIVYKEGVVQGKDPDIIDPEKEMQEGQKYQNLNIQLQRGGNSVPQLQSVQGQ